jgi:hypothetical protein
MNEVRKLEFKSEFDFTAYIEDECCLKISGFDYGCMNWVSIKLDKSDTLELFKFLKDALGDIPNE